MIVDELSGINRSLKRSRLLHETSDPWLNVKRARHDLHLKSRFEEIFQKYGRDFSGIADEIDLETGEIVVDRGHIAAMTDETDPGQQLNPDSYRQLDIRSAVNRLDPQNTESIDTNDDNASQEQEPHLPAKSVNSHTAYQSLSNVSEDNITRFTTKGSVQNAQQCIKLDKQALEPAWQAPLLPVDRSQVVDQSPLFSITLDEPELERSPSPPTGSLWAPLTGPRRPLNDGSARQRTKSLTKRMSSLRLQGLDIARKPKKRRENKTRVPLRQNLREWTLEEEELLLKLKKEKHLKYLDMESYFPGRTCRQLSYHWSKVLLCGQRCTQSRVGAPSSIIDPFDMEDEISLSSTTPISRSAPPKLKARHPTQSSSDPQHLSRQVSEVYSSPSRRPGIFGQLAITTLDDFDELGADPTEEESAILNKTSTTLSLVIRSRSQTSETPTQTQKKDSAVSPDRSAPQPLAGAMQPNGMVHEERKDESSDYDELGLDYPRQIASAPASRVWPLLPTSTPVPFRKHPSPNRLPKAALTPKLTVVEDSSEDELSTPIKNIRLSGPMNGRINTLHRAKSPNNGDV